MKRQLLAASLVLVGLGPGCNRSPTSPTAFRQPVQNVPASPAAPTAQRLHGYVSDTAFRPMGGVRLEVLSGPDAGKELNSDPEGAFAYVGAFSGGVSIRATKEGYLPMTSSVFCCASDSAWVSFLLSPVAPPIEAAGNYTLTITVSSACPGFPDDALVRSYQAKLTKHTAATVPANTQFDGSITGAQFAPYSNVFWVGVAGDYLAVSTEGEGPSIVEQIGPKSYIAYMGAAGASVPSGSPTTISAPFNGSVEYCELKSPIGQYYDCSDSLAAVKVQCASAIKWLTLTPR